MMTLEPGLTHEKTLVVEYTDTARASAGGSLPEVLSTPRVIAYLERTAHEALSPYFSEGQSSVGASVNMRHMAATPVGMQVRFRVEVLEVEGRRVKFKIEAWDEVDKIAEGDHERFIIDEGRFNERLEKKRQQIKK
jgi:fluoroacetyl-CoA thioesterase